MGTIRRLMGRPAQAVANTAAPAARWIRSRVRKSGNTVVTIHSGNVVKPEDPDTPRTKALKKAEPNLRREAIKTHLSKRSTTMDKAKLLDKLATFKDGTLMSVDRRTAYLDDQSDKDALFEAIVGRAANKYSSSDKSFEKFITDLEEHISSNR